LHGVSAYRQASARRRVTRLLADPWFIGPITGAVAHEVREQPPSTLQAALRRSVEVAPLPLYLRVEDRNSMAHSLEARLPFLDYRLVSLAFRLGDDWKLRAPWNKYLLRESMRGRIPENVRARADKFGFPSPVDVWCRGPWYEGIRELLESPLLQRLEVCNVQRIRTDLERHKRGEVNIGTRLFDVAQLVLWLGMCERSGVALAA
jgi:asparagine synthase (glutamine-hydrolysing)